MTMDISNQNKLSEFYEELKRLNINIVRPDINKCYADFRADDKNFYYALGGIKSVGYEAVSNIVKERIKNGEFKSVHDFINRVNPKDINKLQLEGLVKAGAFDEININRQALFNSIPNLILKSKNNFENKVANQIDLFLSDEVKDEDIILQTDDWNFEERLSKEFEAVGFFISDHPLNQFKEIFEDYKIIDFNKFNLKEIGPKIENHSYFPEKCNVTLANVKNRKHVKVKVWERGAGLTKACGTAACATAVSGAVLKLSERCVDIEFPGGLLNIGWKKDNNIYMTGMVSEVKKITVSI